MSNKIEEIEKVIQPALAELGFELVDIEYTHEHKNSVLRVFIDRENGVSLDDCSAVSDKIGAVIEGSSVLEESYILEVSSPGLDRKLKKEADFIRFNGKKVKIRLFAPIDGQRNFEGYIGKYESGILVIDGITQGNNKSVSIELKNIALARLEPEINFN